MTNEELAALEAAERNGRAPFYDCIRNLLTTERTRREAAERAAQRMDTALADAGRGNARLSTENRALRERAEKAEAALMEWRGTAATNAQALVDANARLATTERERDEARAEVEKARAAMGHGTDDARWRPGETAVDALVRENETNAERCLEAFGDIANLATERNAANASRDAALAALAKLRDAVLLRYVQGPESTAALDLDDVLAAAASPAALGAKVIAAAEERGARWMKEAVEDAASPFPDYPPSLDPAEVCKAAGGAR